MKLLLRILILFSLFSCQLSREARIESAINRLQEAKIKKIKWHNDSGAEIHLDMDELNAIGLTYDILSIAILSGATIKISDE